MKIPVEPGLGRTAGFPTRFKSFKSGRLEGEGVCLWAQGPHRL